MINNFCGAELTGENIGKKFVIKKSRISYPSLILFVLLFIIFSTKIALAGTLTLPLMYTFNSDGKVEEANSMKETWSPYWWVISGGRLVIANGVGSTFSGELSPSDSLYKIYTLKDKITYDNGTHPQNAFQMLSLYQIGNLSTQIYFNRIKDNFSNFANRHAYNGEAIVARYQDVNNYYYGGLRADGNLIIKKKKNGVYQNLAIKKILSGTYNDSTNPDLIPLKKWIGLKMVITDSASGVPTISLYTDIGKTDTWKLEISVIDDFATFGDAIPTSGYVGVQSDFADMQFDNFKLENFINAASILPIIPATNYDSIVLDDNPVLYLAMNTFTSGTENDKTGKGNNGIYMGGNPTLANLPNGDTAADFNGSSEYLSVPSSSDLSISTTQQLTWEAWIRPDTLQFPYSSSDGYVEWMGKCRSYSPTCEWEARMYSSSTAENRPSRLSAYVFNNTADLGSAADWQPSSNVIKAGQWLHVVGEYQTQTTPSECSSSYPGTINIWVNGVKQSFVSHYQTGCMSQYNIIPKAGTSPLIIGTMAMDYWFKGAIGKVAIYHYLLSQTQINNHFKTMTGSLPSGSCLDTCTTSAILVK